MAVIKWRDWHWYIDAGMFAVDSTNTNIVTSNGATGGNPARLLMNDFISLRGFKKLTVSFAFKDSANMPTGQERNCAVYLYSNQTYTRSLWKTGDENTVEPSGPGKSGTLTYSFDASELKDGETEVRVVSYWGTVSTSNTCTITDFAISVEYENEEPKVPAPAPVWKLLPTDSDTARTMFFPGAWSPGTSFTRDGNTITGTTGANLGSKGSASRIIPSFYPTTPSRARVRNVVTLQCEQAGEMRFLPQEYRSIDGSYGFVGNASRLEGAVSFPANERVTVATPWMELGQSGDTAVTRTILYFNASGANITIYDARYEYEDTVTRDRWTEPDFRFVAYDVLGDRIGQLPDTLKATVTQPRNAASTLALDYAPSGVNVDVLKGAVELGVEWTYTNGLVWEEVPNGRFISQSVESNAVDDGTKAVSFKGIHIGHMLDEAVLWEVPAESQDSDGKWNFLSRNAGTILRTVWDAAVERGWGKGLTLDVTASTDSAGEAWATITTLAFDRTITLAKVLDSLTDIGMIDWVWEGRTLRVFNADTALTRDISSLVLWPYAKGTTSAPESKSWADLCTDVLVKGEGGNVWKIHNDQAPADLRRIEKVVEAGGVEQEATARMVAEATLQTGANVAEEIKREWVASDFRWWPYADYRVGDWVGVQREERVEKLQVAQLSITMDDKGITGHTTFGTVLDDLLSRMAKKQKGIVGAASIAGNTTRPADTAAKRTPAVPQGLVCRTTPYTLTTGAERAVLEASWGSVAVDDRGNALDGIEYELLAIVGAETRVWPMGSGTSGTVDGLIVGDTYQIYVRAVATGEGTRSDWSDGVTLTVEGETTPPPTPSKPTVTGSLAVLTVTWDGLDSAGNGMPSDFSHFEVSAVAVAATPVVVARTYSPSERVARIPGLSYGTYEIRIRAVDTHGNVSGWSDYSQVILETTVDSEAIKEQLDLMLPEITEASAIYQRAAALVAGGDVKWGPYPPDEGEPGVTFWIAPDGKLWLMESKAEGV